MRVSSGWAISILTATFLVGTGCATNPGSGVRTQAARGAEFQVVYETIEQAAAAALAEAYFKASPVERFSVRVGAIRTVGGGYSWMPPTRGRSLLQSKRRTTMAYSLRREDVATYLIHPATGNNRIDRENEKLSKGERRFVDEIDPVGRALFLLTPSRKIVRYERGQSDVVVARLARPVVDRSERARTAFAE